MRGRHHPRRPLIRRPLFWVLVGVLLLIAGIRLVLDPVAAHYTRQTGNRVRRVNASVWRFGADPGVGRLRRPSGRAGSDGGTCGGTG